MTHDEMIAAERRIIALHRGYAEGSRQFAEIMTGQWDVLFENDILLIRAAIRVIAPAVLGDAEQRCRYVAKHNYDRQEEGPYRDGFEIACEVCETSIRDLKTRYEQ